MRPLAYFTRVAFGDTCKGQPKKNDFEKEKIHLPYYFNIICLTIFTNQLSSNVYRVKCFLSFGKNSKNVIIAFHNWLQLVSFEFD